jgi:cytochrome P450
MKRSTEAARIDLADTELFVSGDPFAAWKWLRQNAPVYWTDDGHGGGSWALTRYEDVVRVYADDVSFSSAKGAVMGGSYRSERDSASGKMLVCTDPPRHRLLRQQMRQGFSPRILQRIDTGIRELLEPAMDQVLADGGCDFATAVAPLLPTGVVMAMLGLDRLEANRILDLTRTMIGFRDGDYGNGRAESAVLVRSQAEMLAFFAEITKRRRSQPGDDLISLLLRSKVNGQQMTEAEILYNCVNVAVGGNETTPSTACGGVLALIEFPNEASRLRADRALLPTAVEEILRWTSTNAYVQRLVTREIDIRGHRIPTGQAVTLWNPSANRDEDVFANADRFDVAREPNRHVAFGVGHHHCIGQIVARLELSILLEQLLDRGIRFRLAGPVERLRSNFMLGIKHLPVSVAA